MPRKKDFATQFLEDNPEIDAIFDQIEEKWRREREALSPEEREYRSRKAQEWWDSKSPAWKRRYLNG